MLKRIVLKVLKTLGNLRDVCLLPLGANSGLFAHVYYSLFNFSFVREHKAVITGRLRYRKNLNSICYSSALLRRNIHRLEKGIIMRPRKSLFAADYISETTKAYSRMLENISKSCEISKKVELKWAFDVLSEYFKIMDDSDKKVNQARELFHSLPANSFEETALCKPYHRDFRKSRLLEYDALLELAKFRRSVRWFRQKHVPRELVDKAITVGAYAPSACNRQPYKFRIFDDTDKIQELVSISMGAAGFGHNVPGLIVVIGSLDAYFHERDRHLIYIDASLASMGLIYALEVQGVSSCPLNWPDVPSLESKIANSLRLEPFERVIMLLAYGFPEPTGMVPYSQKKPLDLLRTYNQ